MPPRRMAVYAGTFDPITNGHRDIVERAVKVFPHVTVAVVEGGPKEPLFSIEERLDMVREAVSHLPERSVVVESFRGLLVDYVQAIGARVIVRGLRAVSDYEYEAQMGIINRQLAPEIETVYLVTSERCSFISSSVVKELARYGGDVSSLVPRGVEERLRARFRS